MNYRDPVLDPIAEFATEVRYARLPAGVVRDCKRRLIDALGCGLGAFYAPTGVIARELALRAPVKRPTGARLLGTEFSTLPELATFSNGTLVRYLDGNDTYLDGGGHPSDVIPAVLAVADSIGAGGAELVSAIVVAYDVYHKLHRATLLREKGWDHTVLTAVGSAAGAANLLGLSPEQTRNAIAIAMTANHALLVTRRETLSQWRGCAAPHAASNGVFAALLASRGMTGPAAAGAGSTGMLDHFGPFELAAFPKADDEPFAISQSHLKAFLCEYHAQGPVSAALELHARLHVEAIETIHVHLYNPRGLDLCTRRLEIWHPETRESADHSLPFIVAGTLLDGKFSDALFAEHRLRDPRIHALTDRIVVSEDDRYSERFPEASPCRIEIQTKGGDLMQAELEYPRGHPRNPMTDAEIEAKFTDLAGRVLSRSAASQALAQLWSIENAGDLNSLMTSVRVIGEH